MKRKHRNSGETSAPVSGGSGWSKWFKGERLKYLLITAAAVFAAYKVGRMLERRKQNDQMARHTKKMHGPVMQQPVQTASRRDNMGFTDVSQDLSGLDDMGCGNKPCSPMEGPNCNIPAVAQADVPSEEFEILN